MSSPRAMKSNVKGGSSTRILLSLDVGHRLGSEAQNSKQRQSLLSNSNLLGELTPATALGIRISQTQPPSSLIDAKTKLNAVTQNVNKIAAPADKKSINTDVQIFSNKIESSMKAMQSIPTELRDLASQRISQLKTSGSLESIYTEFKKLKENIRTQESENRIVTTQVSGLFERAKNALTSEADRSKMQEQVTVSAPETERKRLT